MVNPRDIPYPLQEWDAVIESGETMFIVLSHTRTECDLVSRLSHSSVWSALSSSLVLPVITCETGVLVQTITVIIPVLTIRADLLSSVYCNKSSIFCYIITDLSFYIYRNVSDCGTFVSFKL